MIRRSGLPITTLRLYSVFGSWEEPGRLMPTFAAQGLKGTLSPLVAPYTVRDYVFVDACIMTASSSDIAPARIFNIGTGRETRLDELVRFVSAELELVVEPVWGSMENRAWDTSTWKANPA